MNFVVPVVMLARKGCKLLYRAHCVRDGEFSLLKIFFFFILTLAPFSALILHDPKRSVSCKLLII